MPEHDTDHVIRSWLMRRPGQDRPVPGDAPYESPDAWLAAGAEIPELENRLAGTLRNDPDPVLRAAAALAIGRAGTASAAGELAAALASDSPMVAAEAASALGVMGQADAVEPLCAALAHADANVRASAATALGTLGGTRALECLRRSLDDENGLVRAAADESLRRLEAQGQA